MEYNQFMEALKGKQKKLDKNHNGELDAQDFKILRKEETEELDEIRRMKTTLNKLDPFSNRSVARQKLSNLMKSGKAKGALIANKMRTLNMGDEIDAEDLDALHEVLSKDAKAGDWIHDFVHSDNPKFAGKSKKERIKMALGAYYGKQNEAYGSYRGYQSSSGASHGHAYGGGGFGRREREDDEYHVPDPVPSKPRAPVAPVPDRKYIKGTPENKAHKAANKPINGHPTNEETELTEANHREYACSGCMHPDMAKNMKTGQEVDFYHSKTGDKLSGVVKHNSGSEVHIKAHKDGKMAAGDVHKFKVTSKLEEAKMTTTKDNSGKLVSFKYEGDWKKTDPKKQGSGKAANLAGKAMQKMAQANEEVVTEANDPHEYADGEMSIHELKQIKAHVEWILEMLTPETDMPEWVQAKITLAADYLSTACDYLHVELNEGAQYAGLEKEDKPGKVKTAVVKLHPKGVESETVEGWKDPKKAVKEQVQKVDIPAYLRKAKGDTPLKMDDLKRKDTLSDAENLKKNRGVKESFDDEGNLIPHKISYKDFITEIKLADLPVRRIQGHSYGANYTDPEGADDYDDKKPMKPAAEKRGRGRPAGAKSGARKITGTSKLMNK